MVKTFENRLKRDLFQFIVIISGSLLAILLLIAFFTFQRIDKEKVDEVLLTTQTPFSDVTNHYSLFLNEDSLFSTVITGESDATELELELYRSGNEIDVNSYLILFDLSGEIIFNSFELAEPNLYMQAYNDLLIGRMSSTEEIKKVNFSQYPNRHFYMIGKKVVEDGLEVGYAIFYVDTISLADKIFNSQFDCVITDEYNNIVATSNTRLTSNFSFLPNADDKFEVDDATYDVTLNKQTYNKLNFYVMVAVRDNVTFYTQIVVMFIISMAVLVFLTNQISNRFAKNNSKTIGLLAGEMEKVKDSDKYRIDVKTGDEFESLADDINAMVKQLRDSRKRNEHLLKQKNVNEIKSLKAQFHPHFLYNTLDTIRYAMFLDPNVAEELLLMMTKILRYSVSNEEDNVLLIDDYYYVEKYIEIHQHRHQGRILYSYVIDKSCENIIVPKLFIQPLIENSIKYGFKDKEQLSINISILKQGNTVMIDIEDTGSGISENRLNIINKNLGKNQNEIIHTGLYNTMRRISLMYPNSIFSIKSEINKGTIVHIEFEVEELV